MSTRRGAQTMPRRPRREARHVEESSWFVLCRRVDLVLDGEIFPQFLQELFHLAHRNVGIALIESAADHREVLVDLFFAELFAPLARIAAHTQTILVRLALRGLEELAVYAIG